VKAAVHTFAVVALLAGVAAPAHAQTADGLKGDLLKATSEVEDKVVGLGNAMTAAQYSWRPGEGVRSVGEVLLHIAADNYFLPAALGVAAPPATRITATDFQAVQAFEKQKLGKEATVAEVKASFEHLKKALGQVPESRMNETINMFGQQFTVRRVLVMTTTHLHEHLGQLIAYARTNGVTPPWSR
jgi:uncharacterized damage-inducible protein DinB